MRGKPDHIMRLIAFGLGALAVLAAGFEFRDAMKAESEPSQVVREDSLAAELVRCRGLTPGKVQTDIACRKAWAENRRRFFAPAFEPEAE